MSRDEANRVEQLWKESESAYYARLGDELRREWSDYYTNLASSHRRLAEETAARAARLLEEDRDG